MEGNRSAADLYEAPALQIPSENEVQRISDLLHLKCSEEEVHACQRNIEEMSSSYQYLDRMGGYSLPVKYPRCPGYRPDKEENKYNAWYYKCDIKGAASGKLAGKRVGIKDNTAVAGVPMMNGSKLLEGYVPEFDATVVTRILDAGGIISGKTSVEDLSSDANSFSNVTGPILNPVDITRTAGGSSSGSAVLLATGEIDLAIGCDQGGSIRVPSSYCGVVGLKPTFGLVPYTGVMGIEMSIDHIGPMARTVQDCALLLEVITGYDDGMDPRQAPNISRIEYSKHLSEDLKGKRIGLLKEGFEVCEKDVQCCVRKAADILAHAGAIVEEVSIKMHAEAGHIFSAMVEGMYNFFIKGNGTGYGYRGYYPISMQEAVCRGLTSRPHDLPSSMKVGCMTAHYVEERYQNKFYSKAQNLNLLLRREYNNALKNYDAILMPTVPTTAPKLPLKTAKTSELLDSCFPMTVNTKAFNLTGHPALTINAGYKDGLPVGMMLVGRHFDESTIFQIAYAFEQLCNKT